MSPDTIETTPAELTGDRRQDYREWRDKVEMRLDAGAQNMREMRIEIADNTTLTKQVQSDTSEVVSLLKSFQGAFKVFNLIGKLAKPLGYIAMAASAVWGLWVTWKNGGPPT